MSELDLGMDFPEPKPKPKPKPKPLSWTRYKVTSKTVHCDTCLAEVHDAWPDRNSAPNLAVFKRTAPDGTISFWCWSHGTDKQAQDDVAKPTKGKAKR